MQCAFPYAALTHTPYIHTHEQTREKYTHEIFLNALEIFAGVRRSVLSCLPQTRTLLHTYTPDLCQAATQRASSYAAHTLSLTYIHTRCLLRCDAVCLVVCPAHTLKYRIPHSHTLLYIPLTHTLTYIHARYTHTCAWSYAAHTLSNTDICLLRCDVVCLIVCIRNFVCVYLVCMYVRVCVSGMYRRVCVSAVFEIWCVCILCVCMSECV